MKKRLLWLLPVLLLLAVSCGAGAKTPSVSRVVLAMDTFMSLNVPGEDSKACLDRIQEDILGLERELSRTLPDSGVSALNAAQGREVAVSDRLAGLLEASLRYTGETHGAFDITTAPLSDLWGFTKEHFQVPPQEEIDALLPAVGPEHIHLQAGTARLDPGTAIDLGGIAKGWALDRAAAICGEEGREEALLNLGGDILALGRRPDGRKWSIGIRDPSADGSEAVSLGELRLENAVALTSGGYERCFEQDGHVYSHIIDPATGAPAVTDLESVTVVLPLAPEAGARADALATALFLMGKEGAEAFWRESGQTFDMLLADEAGRVYFTPGLRRAFTPQKPEKYTYLAIHG